MQSGTSGYVSIDQMPTFNFPSCPVHKDEPHPEMHTPSSCSKITSQPQRGHRRARTSVHASPALPAFSFGAASPDNEPEPITPVSSQTSSQTLLPPATPTSRHRRAVSELVGEHPIECITPSQRVLPGPGRSVSILAPQAARHRHRRSGAVSSQDLSALRRPLSIDQRPCSPDKTLDTSNPARAVEFSDHVEVIPRPQSMVSSSSGSSHSTLKPFESSRTVDISDQQSPHESSPSLQGTGPEHRASFSDLSFEPSMNIDIVELNEDFDDDPTSTVVSHAPQHSSEPAAGAYPSLQPSISSHPLPAEDELPRDDIDLDLASVDNISAPSRSPIRGSSFQRARASMHSAGGHFSGFMAPGYQGHRRAESAPSLAPVSFGLRNGVDISHEMPAVFEDPEEDDVDTPPERTDTPDCRASFVSSTASSPDQDNTPRALAGRRDIHSSPNLLPPIEFHSSKLPDDERIMQRPRHSADGEREALRLPKPAFVITEEPSASSKSSPKYARSYISSSEPSPGFQHSVEDVPSLISCGSTNGSSTVQQTRPSLSAPSLDHDIAKSISSLAPSSKAGHRKRLSIMSMSMSKLFTTNGPNSNDTATAEPHAQRSQSTAGLRPPSPSKGRRLSRILKIFRKKPSLSPTS